MVGVSAPEELTDGVHGEKHKVFRLFFFSEHASPPICCHLQRREEESLQSECQERHDSYVGTVCQRASVKV